jgi:hypothetical protein
MISSSSTPKSGVGLRSRAGSFLVPCRRGICGIRAPPAPYDTGCPSLCPPEPQVSEDGVSSFALPFVDEEETADGAVPFNVLPEPEKVCGCYIAIS